MPIRYKKLQLIKQDKTWRYITNHKDINRDIKYESSLK